MRRYVPMEHRPFAVSVIEISWGLSSLVGLPLLGFLMATAWLLPFSVFGVLSLLTAAALFTAQSRMHRATAVDSAMLKDPAAAAPAASSAELCSEACSWENIALLKVLRSPQGFSLLLSAVLTGAAFGKLTSKA